MRSLIVFFGVIVFTFGAWINNCEDYIKFETDPISTKVANKDFSITLKNDGSDDCSFLVILKDKNSGECIGGKSISIDAGKEYVLDINYSGDSAFIASDKANYVAKDAQFVIASNTSFGTNDGDGICAIWNEIMRSFFGSNSAESDDFAIRPYRFKVDILTGRVLAGEDFNITVKALDYKGNVVQNYEENLSVRGDSPTIDYEEIKNGCKEGNLTITGDSDFNNEINTTLSYTEVGEINLSILEKVGSEFAIIDKDDTSESDRLIKADSVLVRVYPYDFNFSKEKKVNSFIYISNDLNMSGELDLNITAVNKKGEITENYNYKCYAEDFNLTFSHNDINETILMYDKKFGIETNTSGDSNVTFELTKEHFSTDNNGSTILEFLLNLRRDYAKPVNPITFELKEVNFTDTTLATSKDDINESFYFIYGRLKVNDAVGYGKEVNSTAKYLYWDNGWVENSSHKKEFGDINVSGSLAKDVDIKIGNIVNAKEDISYTTSHVLPYGVVVHFDIPSWLFYNPLAVDFKKPSNDNLDCRTHLCARVTFLGYSDSWGGVRSINPKYSEENRSVNITPYKLDTNVSKQEVKRINW